MKDETFNVVQFFTNETYECVRNSVDVDEAVTAAKHYTESIAAQAGLVDRVIITDSLDCCVFEWRRGHGVTFPPLAMRRQN